MTGSEALAHPIEEAAKRIGVGRTSMYKLIADGDIATVKVGRRRVVPEVALIEFLESRLEVAGAGGRS